MSSAWSELDARDRLMLGCAWPVVVKMVHKIFVAGGASLGQCDVEFGQTARLLTWHVQTHEVASQR